MIHKKISRVKAIPVKRVSLCNKCVYGCKELSEKCEDCYMRIDLSPNIRGIGCLCSYGIYGDRCYHFKPKKPSIRMTNDSIIFRDENDVEYMRFYAGENGTVHLNAFGEEIC